MYVAAQSRYLAPKYNKCQARDFTAIVSPKLIMDALIQSMLSFPKDTTSPFSPSKHSLMDLSLREEYWIKFCMKFIAVISHDNYYGQFYDPSCEQVQK
jgi:hypothetical protein